MPIPPANCRGNRSGGIGTASWRQPYLPLLATLHRYDRGTITRHTYGIVLIRIICNSYRLSVRIRNPPQLNRTQRVLFSANYQSTFIVKPCYLIKLDTLSRVDGLLASSIDVKSNQAHLEGLVL